MPIDDCKHKFKKLVTKVLPAHQRRLRKAMRNPIRASLFTEPKMSAKAIANRLQPLGDLTRCYVPEPAAATCAERQPLADFAGCYVFLENGKPIYAGISRHVLARVRQHLRGKTHFDASLAYRMAARRMKLKTKLQRREAMQRPGFKKAFENRQAYLRRLQVAFVPIENHLEMYLFEAFCAMEFDCEWNTFSTH